MAFTTTDQKISSVNQAASLIHDLRTLYTQAKAIQTKLALYTAATDTTFNTAINAIFTSTDRTELGQMLAQIDALATDWETNHRGPIGLP